MEEKFRLKDESGDKKYFTIVPNYILNHSTATAQALYLQLKKLAGENGVAYPGRRYLAEKLKISYPTLKKEIKYLLDKKWIEYVGKIDIETDGGRQKVKSYRIVDLWGINSRFYQRGEKIEPPFNQRGEKIEPPFNQRGEKIEPPFNQRGEKIEPQGGKTRGEKIATKQEPIKQEPSSKKKTAISSSTEIPDGLFDDFDLPVVKVFQGLGYPFGSGDSYKDFAEWLDEATVQFKGISISDEALKFRDYWEGSGRKVKRHKQAFRNWLTNAKLFSQNRK
jgi:hypothetical protein